MGLELVDEQGGGTERSRARLKVILRTLTGELTIQQAAAEMGVSRSRFHAIRSTFFREAPAILEPDAPGPAPSRVPEELVRLRREVEELRRKHALAELREELTLLTHREESAEAAERPARRFKKKVPRPRPRPRNRNRNRNRSLRKHKRR